MANTDISLLFGVLGKGSLSGASGKLIKSQLTQIMAELNKTPLKVKVGIDTASGGGRSWSGQLQQKLDQISANGKFSAQISTLKLSPGAVSDFKKQLAAVVNTVGLSTGTQITISAAGIGEIKSKLKDAQDAIKKTGIDADEASRKIAEFKVQMEALSSQKKTVKQSIDALGKIASTEAEKTQVSEISARYEKWAIEIEKVRAAKAALPAGQRAAIEAEGAAILSNIERINAERIAREDAARAAENAEKNMAAASKRRLKEDAAAQAQKNAALKAGSALLAQMEKAERDWTAARNGSSKISYSRLLGDIAALKKYNIQLYTDTKTVEEFRRNLILLQRSFSSNSNVIKSAGENVRTFGSRIGGLAQKFSAWLSVSQLIMLGIRSVRRMISVTIELDDAMTQLKIVTRDTSQVFDAYLGKITETASRIGASVSDLIDSTTTFARLGYSLTESSSLAEFTAMLQNVGDIDTDAAQDAITAIIKAFGVSVDDIESIMDKLVITGNNFPISVAQIAEGMNNASSALAAAGNTFDQSVALLTAANTTIQNAAKSSTGLRTIVARLRSTKTELDELGEAMTEAEYDELVAALSKYNVSLTNAAGEFRSTYDIVADIASVWDDLSSMEQAALANIIAGVRQQSVFYSLIEQFQEAAGAMNDMENSAGTLQKSYKTFMESITAHINQFKAAFQSFSQSTFTTNFMNGIIDLGTNVLKILDSISRLTNVVGGLNTVLYVTAGIIATIKADSIFTQLVRLAAPIKAIIATLQTARAAGVKTGQFISNAFNQIAVSVSTAQIAIGGVVLAIAAIAGAAAIYKALHKSTEELVEISNELKDSFREVKEQAEDNISTLQSLSDEFTRLADGVDRYGRNISLSANDYERYKEIIEQIVGISPELIDGYDKENGYLVDKNNLLERAIALQEEEYRNELRRMTTTSNISTAVAGAAAIYADLESDEALKAGSSLTNAIYRLFNVNSRDDIPKEMESGEFLARQIMEALGVENVDKELEKYFNEHRYWQSDWFFDDYIDQIAKDIGSSRSLILPHIDFEAAGFESSDAFVNAVEEVKSAASEYSDVQSELTQANQDISDQLKLVAESNQQYANLSANAREIISDFVNSFGVNDITKAGWFGGKVIDEDAINRIKVEINDFVEKFTPEIQELVDTGFSLQLGFDVDGGELLIEDYRRKVSKLLNSIDDVEDKDLQLYIRTSLGIDEDSTTLNNDIEKAIAHVKNLLVDTPVDKSELENLLTWYKQEINDAKELGVDLNKTVYGNIDTNNRQILEWTEDNLEQYRDVIDSWRFNDELLEDVMESLRGSTSTIMGTSENFDGVEIAFSPILQTENGAVYLDRDTLHQYINDLIEKAGSNWTSDDLLRLDAEGLEYDGMRIQNMLADVGETAINTGESMHFAGNLGGIQTAYSELREAALNAGMTVEELNNAIENGDFDKLRTVQEIVDSLSVDKALHIYYNISADPHSMTFDDLQKKLDLLGVDWSKTINVWDFSPMVESLGDIESKVSDVVSAMNSLQNGTRLTAEEIAKLALKYPDLLKASNLFTDTSIENQKTLLDSILGTYESEYDALVDTKIAELTATNKLIENQINLENEKKNKVIEIADLQSNGKLDSERDYQKLLDELHDLEGQNFVTFSDGVLDVNEDMLKKMLKNDGKSVDASKPIWGALGNMILEGHADGLGEALKAFPQYLAKLKDWAGSSLKTLLSNIGTNIGKALSGNTDFVSLGDGIQSIGTVSAGNVTIETIVEGNYTIDGESVDEWTADYKNVIESRVKTLTDQITANEIIVNNLKSMKGLDLKSLYGGSGSTSRNGKTDNEGQDKLEEYIADIDTYYEALKRLEAIQIRLSALENALEHTTSEREKIGLTEQLIRVYKDEIDALETLNGLRKDTIQNSIKELQALGFEIDYNSDSNEFLVRNLEHLNELEGKTLEETNELRKGTEELINTLDDLNAANQDSVDSMADFCAEIEQSKQRIIDYLDNIVTSAHDSVDKVQNVFDVLKAAADEYADNGGFISVDAFQSILELGPQYMQYLKDENGLLSINEESINQVIEAKVRQLAAEQALTYVERIRLALQEGAIENLDDLLYATTEATNATFGLAYAELELMHSMGDLNDSQYAAALHNIQAIESLANTTVASIGKVSGEYSENLKKELENMKSGLDDILKYVMDMLKHRTQQQIDTLEDLKSAYGDIIDLRKEALDAAKRETEYEDKVAEKVKQIAKLQERINALSLDDSRDAQAQKVKLEEEMAKLQKELADDQSDYAVDAQKNTLDDMKSAYEEEKDAEIATLEETISSYQKLYDMAIEYIQNNWNTLYGELIAWNTEYGSVLNSEITTAWENCLAAAQRYGSYVAALNSIDTDIAASTSNSGSSGSGGNSNNTIVGAAGNNTTQSKDDSIHAIIKEMYANGQAWGTASDKEKDRLDNRNLQLGTMLAQYGIKTHRDNGTWYMDGSKELLFDKYRKYIYHKGGIAGDNPTLKQSEIMAVLEKGEAVLDEQREKGLYRLVDFATTLSDKFAQLMKSTDMRQTLTGTGGLTNAKAGVPANISDNHEIRIEFGDTYITGTNEETVEKHRTITRQQANILLDQLKIKR